MTANTDATPGREVVAISSIDPEIVKRSLRIDYLGARSENASKLMDGVAGLLAKFHRPPMMIRELCQDAANYIQRQFRLRWVMIGLRGPDGIYRYELMAGMKADAWELQKARTYKKEDFALKVEGFFNAGEISKLTRVYLEEENPLDEEDLKKINRPFLLHSRRKSKDDTLEADFIDTLILDSSGDLLGWIEYSGTVTNKFPDAMTVRWVELIASVLAAAISTQGPHPHL